MKHSDFTLGLVFMMSGRRWRCTDVGTRIIAAICLEGYEDTSWFNGPPYAVDEVVIDEDDFPACEPVEQIG